MTVYVLTAYMDYEGEEFIGVFINLAHARSVAVAHRRHESCDEAEPVPEWGESRNKIQDLLEWRIYDCKGYYIRKAQVQ